MVSTQDELVKIGLTKGEAKVYISLIELGSCTVGPIVKKSGVAYSNIYEILERLKNKGLASFIIRGKRRYFQAARPENLSDYLEKRENDIKAQKEILSKMLPALNSLHQIKPEQEAEIFVGFKGLKAAYLKIAADYKGEEWLFFYIHREGYSKESDVFFRNMSRWFRKLSSLSARGICNEEYRKSKYIQNATFMKIRYVNFPIPGTIDICRNKILLVSWSVRPVAFLITSQEVADTMREYFESVWKAAKK